MINLPGSGNHLQDRLDREIDEEERRGEDYCSDCKHSPCICDEEYERWADK